MPDIHPDDINVNRHFFGAFGHMETEHSARWIVQLCQELRGWHPFTPAALEQFYQRHSGSRDFRLNGLDDQGYLTFDGQHYHVTPEFIRRCHTASPRAT